MRRDRTADELALDRYLKGIYTWGDYLTVCSLEECEPRWELRKVE